MSLGELLENLVLSTFAGRNLFSEPALALVGELARIYDLDTAKYSPPILGVQAAQEGE